MHRKLFRVCVVPTNAGEEAVLRSAHALHLPTAGMAREGDYGATFAARHGLYLISDYDTPDGTRASCRAAVARECSHVLVVDNPACRLAWRTALGCAVDVVADPHARPACPRGDVMIVCCPEPPAWLRGWLHATFRRWRAECTEHPRVHALRRGVLPKARPPRRSVGPSKLKCTATI